MEIVVLGGKERRAPGRGSLTNTSGARRLDLHERHRSWRIGISNTLLAQPAR
jgi:hypothetical protein